MRRKKLDLQKKAEIVSELTGCDFDKAQAALEAIDLAESDLNLSRSIAAVNNVSNYTRFSSLLPVASESLNNAGYTDSEAQLILKAIFTELAQQFGSSKTWLPSVERMNI